MQRKVRACVVLGLIAGLSGAVNGCLPISAPGIPVLLTPADGAGVESTSGSFSWSTVSQAGQYTLTIGLDPSLAASSVVFQSSVGEATQITLEGFDSGTTYYWTVRASNSAGDSAAASTRSFTAGGGGTGTDRTARIWTKMSEPTNAFLTSVWGRSWNNVYAAGWGGVIVHYNGVSWARINGPFEETSHFKAIWGSSSTDIWAVGAYGAAYHFDGTQWTSIPNPRGIELTDVWEPIYYVTYATENSLYGSTLLRYAGQGWIPQDIPTTTPLFSIWGTGTDNIFVVGAEGNILHYNGASWSKMSTPTTETLLDVWGFAGGPVFVVGTNGTILQLSGNTWNQMPYPLSIGTSGEPLPTLRAIWGTGPTDVLVCGDGTLNNRAMLYFDGSDWHQCDDEPMDAYGIWGSSTDDVFLVGFEGIFHSTAP